MSNDALSVTSTQSKTLNERDNQIAFGNEYLVVLVSGTAS
jgi:hypothetical protein